MTLKELLYATIDVNGHWGDRMPMMAMEEMAELTQALSKKERNPYKYSSTKDIEEEMRDVLICIGALMNRYDISPNEIEQAIKEKLKVKYDKEDPHEMFDGWWNNRGEVYDPEENRRFLEGIKEELARKAFSIWY